MNPTLLLTDTLSQLLKKTKSFFKASTDTLSLDLNQIQEANEVLKSSLSEMHDPIQAMIPIQRKFLYPNRL